MVDVTCGYALCRLIILICIAVAMGFTIVAIYHIPPSLPFFALQSFTPQPSPNAAANNTITAQNWQVSLFSRNTNTNSLRSPAKNGAVFYGHINASLLLHGAGQDLYRPFTLSQPFDQEAGQGNLVQLRFPGNGTAAGTEECTVEERDYSGLWTCRTMKFSMEWNARVRFQGTTRDSMKLGVVKVVCKDVKVFVSSDTTVVNGDSKECFVRGTWSTVHHVAKKAWSLIITLMILVYFALPS